MNWQWTYRSRTIDVGLAVSLQNTTLLLEFYCLSGGREQWWRHAWRHCDDGCFVVMATRMMLQMLVRRWRCQQRTVGVVVRRRVAASAVGGAVVVIGVSDEQLSARDAWMRDDEVRLATQFTVSVERVVSGTRTARYQPTLHTRTIMGQCVYRHQRLANPFAAL